VAWSSNLFKPLWEDKPIFSELKRPVLFEDGVGAVLDNKDKNPHVFPILKADPGSYSYNPNAPKRAETGLFSGEQLTLVAGYQTQYNQRIVISGSTKMCSNEAMLANRDPEQGLSLESSPNYVLCTEMVEWNLQERGVIRVSNVLHRKVGDEFGQQNPENYKRLVEIEYFIDIHEKQHGQWVPHVSDDVQFQFRMLDPYYQVALEQPDQKSPTYTYQLKTPWRLGIFRFHVDYKRYGLTYIDNRMEVSVIQLRHDEFPRFETTGYPYYVNVLVLMASSFLFVVFFVFSDFSKVKGVKQV
jgi:oligosaccharyltransferase complex subunit beta